MLVSICICTYKRPHIKITLESIAHLSIPDDISIQVVVVDNDEELTAKSLALEFKSTFDFEVDYAAEPHKNISSARNRCLNIAKGELIAFIDDDEIADRNWLSGLLTAMDDHKADVVFGRVVASYPENTPTWIINGGFFDRAKRETGSRVSSGGCGCTLIKASILGSQRFDLSYGLSGGEDADFFYRLYKLGVNLIYCNEAFVTEEVAPRRLNIQYLITRNIRIGSSFSKYRYSESSFIDKSIFILRSAFLLSFFGGCSIMAFLSGREITRYRYFLRACDHYGKVKYFVTNNLTEMY